MFLIAFNRKVYISSYVYIIWCLCMQQRTTIQIEKRTLERMKKLRITKRETYDEIINRLIGKK
jgi:hypothetical protein